MNLINYELFRQRKKFNPIRLFERNENLTYEIFCNFFESRFVIPPDTKYFLRVKEEFEKNKKTQNHDQLEKDTVVEVAVEKAPILEIAVDPVPKDQVVKTPTKRRKSRRKNND